ncbi:hypothetical protein O3G_MSEX001884 [Manduca sexta]|uniref:Uncharacterized protein n=1 Tax=Manduca sexta TaxID=7130 RepID=A0A921YLX2_MANSE|nr:hypothetical protein O3G_MSEX001884 [Manduca sexta]KAG6441565.1 hypothetical protein O3G_MSEX001884 [Manduca sexta]
MELMSSLLLCTFVVMAPQALAESFIHTDWDTIYNDTMKNRQRPSIHNKILLNINAPPLVNVVSEVQAVFAEAACQNCIACMERAIKADKINLHMVDNRPSAEELQTDVLSERHNFDRHREKRNLANDTVKLKKVKSKRNKVLKAVIVTKLKVDEQLYALKVKETITQTGEQLKDMKSTSTTCQVYDVKNSFPCDTPEAEILLTVAKQRVNKKSKKQKEKRTVPATTHKIVPLFRKRQVDHSQVPENFMPSIEDIY